MKLSAYIQDTDRKVALAAACGTSPDYLWQIATAWNGRRAGKALAILIEDRTDGAVTRYDLRPDIFGAEPMPDRQVA